MFQRPDDGARCVLALDARDQARLRVCVLASDAPGSPKHAHVLMPESTEREGSDLQAVPLAIVEKSRGTQLSVVGIRIVHLCNDCDADDIRRWQDNRPNPLLPGELPTVDPNEAG